MEGPPVDTFLKPPHITAGHAPSENIKTGAGSKENYKEGNNNNNIINQGSEPVQHHHEGWRARREWYEAAKATEKKQTNS